MRSLLLPCAVLVAMATLLPAGDTAPADPTAQIQQLKQQIEAQNLINGLGLTAEQLSSLDTLAQETQARRTELLATKQDLLRQYIEDCDRLRAALAQGSEVPPEVAGAFHKSETAVKEAMLGFEKELSERSKRVAAILTPEQLEVVRTFKPCMLPPKDQKEPVRAGQSTESARAEKLLQRLRAMDEARFDVLKEEIVERILDEYEHSHMPFTEEEHASERDRILAEAVRARAMSDAEFELSKRDLLGALHPKDRAKDLGDEAALVRAERLGGDADRERLVRYFLTEGATAALDAKLAAMKAWKPGDPTDLGTIKPADSCKDGKCAVDDDKKPGKKGK